MKEQTERSGIISPSEWVQLSDELRLERCQRAQLDAANAIELLKQALARIATAMGALRNN